MLETFISCYFNSRRTWGECLDLAASYLARWHKHGADVDELYHGMNAIEEWSYSNIPAFMYDELCEVMGYTPRSTLNMFNGPD